MIVWRTLNVGRDGSSFRWHQPCSKQTALKVHHFDGIFKIALSKATVIDSDSHTTRVQ